MTIPRGARSTLLCRAPRQRGARARVSICVGLAGVLAAASLLGCRSPAPDPALTDPTIRAARIEALEEAIAADHATLEDLISRPGAGEARPIHEEPEVRLIGERLTNQERELARLIELRDREEALPSSSDGS